MRDQDRTCSASEALPGATLVEMGSSARPACHWEVIR